MIYIVGYVSRLYVRIYAVYFMSSGSNLAWSKSEMVDGDIGEMAYGTHRQL